MKKIIISPQAGFGNRMRSLVSSKVLGDYLNREVYHYWILDDRSGNTTHVNQMKAITPEYIFDIKIPLYNQDGVDICYSEWLEGDYWWFAQSTAQSKLKCNAIKKLHHAKEIESCDEDSILIESSHSLIPEKLDNFSNQIITATYKKYFKLNDRWKKIYDSLPTYEWGIHVRKGDFLFHFPKEDVSMEQASNAIKKLDGSKIIFSDDLEFRDQLREQSFCYSSIDNCLKGVDSCIIDFLTLSKCKNILNTNKSSFGEQAALFGGSNYISFSCIK